MLTLNWFAADRLQGGSINTLIDVLQVDFTALILVAKQIRYVKPEHDCAAINSWKVALISCISRSTGTCQVLDVKLCCCTT